jgi:hypothetical protein
MYEEAIARRTKRHLKEGHWKAFLLALLEEKKREEKGRRSNFVVGVGQDAKQPKWPHPPLVALVGAVSQRPISCTAHKRCYITMLFKITNPNLHNFC